jgi:hypothetical protein
MLAAKGKESRINGSVDKLNAGAIPVLAQGRAEGQDQDRKQGGDEREARRQPSRMSNPSAASIQGRTRPKARRFVMRALVRFIA